MTGRGVGAVRIILMYRRICMCVIGGGSLGHKIIIG